MSVRINKCQLQEPPALTHIKQCLWILHLSHNNITFIPDQYFYGCTYLSSIYIANNMLIMVPNVAHVSRTLVALYFEGNAITEVSTLYGIYLPNLQLLNIGFNDVQTFRMPPQRMWPKLEQLNVEANKLSSFYFPPWGGLVVNVMNNPINCNSMMSWVHRCEKEMFMPNEDRISGLTCFIPSNITGRRLQDRSK